MSDELGAPKIVARSISSWLGARYWTTGRGVQAMDYSYDLLDMTVYGRQETSVDSSPAGHNSVATLGLAAARPLGIQCGRRAPPGKR